MWELVKSKGGGFGVEPVSDKEVSIVKTTSGKTEMYRINMQKVHFPEGTKSVKVMVDKDSGKIGFFILGKEELFDGKGLTTYGKKSNSKLVYVTMSKKLIDEVGFAKGRYKILKKEDVEGMYFYISTKKRVDGTVIEKKEEKELVEK